MECYRIRRLRREVYRMYRFMTSRSLIVAEARRLLTENLCGSMQTCTSSLATPCSIESLWRSRSKTSRSSLLITTRSFPDLEYSFQQGTLLPTFLNSYRQLLEQG